MVIQAPAVYFLVNLWLCLAFVIFSMTSLVEHSEHSDAQATEVKSFQISEPNASLPPQTGIQWRKIKLTFKHVQVIHDIYFLIIKLF